MSEEIKNIELKEEDLEKVSGGSITDSSYFKYAFNYNNVQQNKYYANSSLNRYCYVTYYYGSTTIFCMGPTGQIIYENGKYKTLPSDDSCSLDENQFKNLYPYELG